jgi:hypothetical protein
MKIYGADVSGFPDRMHLFRSGQISRRRPLGIDIFKLRVISLVLIVLTSIGADELSSLPLSKRLKVHKREKFFGSDF